MMSVSFVVKDLKSILIKPEELTITIYHSSVTEHQELHNKGELWSRSCSSSPARVGLMSVCWLALRVFRTSPRFPKQRANLDVSI